MKQAYLGKLIIIFALGLGFYGSGYSQSKVTLSKTELKTTKKIAPEGFKNYKDTLLVIYHNSKRIRKKMVKNLNKIYPSPYVIVEAREVYKNVSSDKYNYRYILDYTEQRDPFPFSNMEPQMKYTFFIIDRETRIVYRDKYSGGFGAQLRDYLRRAFKQ